MANPEHLEILVQGAEIWNLWREENPEIIPNLSDTNLKGINLIKANFENANFENANLSKANLIKADFTRANVRKVNFRKANIYEANFRFSDLFEANLSEADFSSTHFFRARLNEVNLSFTNLFKSHFGGVQALNTNLKNSNLTGACIKDWNINRKTQLDDVICDYIYLNFDHEQYRRDAECRLYGFNYCQYYTDRRPSDPSKIFAPGDFARLVQQANETVDLIFSEGIDWNAFLNSFQNLQIEGNYGELSIQAIEKKRAGFVVRVEVPEDVDKGEIETNFKLKYETELKLLETEYRSQLQAKDREIEIYKQQSTDILELAKLAASRPITVETRAMVDQSKSDRIIKIKTQEIHGSAYTEGNTIYNESPQNPSLVEAAKEIQELLKHLEANNPTTTTSEQMAIATKAVQQIESDPSLKQKAINAVKGGAVEALKQTSIGAIVVAAIEGWTKR